MIRIVHICSDSNAGGAVISLLRLLSASMNDEFHHFVLIPDCSVMSEEFVSVGADVIKLKHGRDNSSSLPAILECANHIRKIRPHIVHTHGAMYGRAASLLCGVRSRIYTRHTYHNTRSSILFRYINKLVTTRAVAVNSALVEQIVLSGISQDRISLIENGTEAIDRQANDSPSRKYNLLYCGRIVYEKGLKLALDAIERLHQEDLRYSLTIVGDGEYKEEILSLLSDRSMTSYVRVFPYTKDITAYLFDCGIAINCSYSQEATSMFILEAMSAGMGVVLSDIAGNSNLIEDGYNGRTFKSGDVDSFVCAVIDVSRSFDEYSKRSSENHKSRFALSRMAAEYHSLWKEEYEKYYQRK